jgi:hypothetical protein
MVLTPLKQCFGRFCGTRKKKQSPHTLTPPQEKTLEQLEAELAPLLKQQENIQTALARPFASGAKSRRTGKPNPFYVSEKEVEEELNRILANGKSQRRSTRKFRRVQAAGGRGLCSFLTNCFRKKEEKVAEEVKSLTTPRPKVTPAQALNGVEKVLATARSTSVSKRAEAERLRAYAIERATAGDKEGALLALKRKALALKTATTAEATVRALTPVRNTLHRLTPKNKPE